MSVRNKIYILEDNPDILEIMTETLTLEGYQVNSYTTVANFKNAISVALPDLFLIDVILPDGHGINICEDLKLNRSTRQIPVILLTAHSEIDKMKIRSRADDFIAKPFQIANLIERISLQLK